MFIIYKMDENIPVISIQTQCTVWHKINTSLFSRFTKETPCRLETTILEVGNNFVSENFAKCKKPSQVQNLAKRNHKLTIFYYKTEREASDSAPFAAAATIPHSVARILLGRKRFVLETSAIASYVSLAFFDVF